jgi:hypothetical protein
MTGEKEKIGVRGSGEEGGGEGEAQLVVSWEREAMVAWTRCSVITSSDDVASSNTITCGLESALVVIL